MSVVINISGENAGEAVRELSALAAHLVGGQAVSAPAETPKTDKPSRANRSTAKQEVESAKQETAADPDPAEAQPGTTEPDPASGSADETDNGPIPTIVELRAKAAEVGAKNKAAVKALLDEFESKSISEIPEEKRTAFMKALEAI